MHGCAGITRWNRQWTARLLEWGFAVLDVDSFGPRSRREVCTYSVSPATRAWDAFGAKEFLSNHPKIDGQRIALLGMSHGASAALIAASQAVPDQWGTVPSPTPPFQAVVALYPWCDGEDMLASPTLILIGELDDWAPAARCKAQATPLTSNAKVEIKVYPGAHHAFDFIGLDVELDGHVLRYHEAAAADAFATTRTFLQQHLE
jgi:dienelactone hydrolase